MKDELMIFDPATGKKNPYPSHAQQWREYYGEVAFIYNPFTGNLRDARDIGTDTFGHCIVRDFK